MKARHSVFLLSALCLASTAVFSQETSQPPEENRTAASRYFLGKANEFLMPVNILGPVNKPGQYMIPSETDLIALVAYAGGFREDARINDVKIVRRMGEQKQPQIIKIDLTKFYTTGDLNLTPPLKPDDTVIIAGKKTVAIRTIADIIRSAAYLAQIIYIYFLIDKK
ncbi:SLBB domain-containing protein [candidate division KSB1 bacterium]|nr:SLBB domain-containing protein [candidate division KSB1 bacterium]